MGLSRREFLQSQESPVRYPGSAFHIIEAPGSLSPPRTRIRTLQASARSFSSTVCVWPGAQTLQPDSRMQILFLLLSSSVMLDTIVRLSGPLRL